MRRTALFCVVAMLSAGSAALALEPKTWDYAGGGHWPLAQVPTTQTRVIPNATLDRAEQMLGARQLSDAHSLLLAWVQNHPDAPDRDRALFLLGEYYRRDDDYLRAFYQFDELLDKYPASRFFYPALEKQYQIADAFLSGHKRSFLGLKILSATEEAIDMLYRIQERSPGSPLAERAMLRTADYYYNSAQFDLAEDVYSAFLRSYPRSPEVPRVRLRKAFSAYAQFRGTTHDATPLIEARTQLEDIKARYPELAAEANVQKFIDSINETLARKMYVTADFWRRTHKLGAAVYTYREILITYPNSKEASLARRQLASMPASALATPPPPGAAEVPTTRPGVGALGPMTRPSTPIGRPPVIGQPPVP